jgi:hypothetical protein
LPLKPNRLSTNRPNRLGGFARSAASASASCPPVTWYERPV